MRVIVSGQVPPLDTSFTKVTTGDGSQLSLADTSAVFGAGTSPMHWTETGPGQAIVGGVVSTTVITWVQVDELLHSSVAVQVRVSVYDCGQLPGVVVSA